MAPWESGLTIDRTLLLSPSFAYIDKILLRFGMQNCNPVKDPNHQLWQKQGDTLNTKQITVYQQIIGSLMYTVIGTRPDLAFSVTLLSQFLKAPNTTHLVLRYLKATRKLELVYPTGIPLCLAGYTDADFAGDKSFQKINVWLYLPIWQGVPFRGGHRNSDLLLLPPRSLNI